MVSLIIIDSNLEQNKRIELEKIAELYDKSYPTKWDEKIKYFDRENEIRTNDELEEYKVGKTFLGYLIKERVLILDDNFIKFIFLRYNGLQHCIYNQESYLENNKDKDTCKEQLYLDYYKIELEKLKNLIFEYEQNLCDIESSKEKKIEFVKKICESIVWGYKELFMTCDEILARSDLHPKTFKNYKQLVLGTRGSTDWLKFLNCNLFFLGPKIMANYNKANIKNDIIKVCDKTVEFNMLVNKYATLASYYKKAPFIRFLLKDGITMPYRRYPPVEEEDKKGNKVGIFNIGPYEYDIYYDKNPMNKIFYDKFYNFTFYDKTNHIIFPPSLRSTITTTYAEWRDLICYLCLPIFCSVVNTKQNRTMLFFPNYDLHQRLLAIQGLPRNYSTYTGRSIEWKWFDEGEIEAKEAITCFCKEFEEGPGYGIEPVQYIWYKITFENENTKKYIFLICSWEEYMTYYRKSEFLIIKTTPNKLYVYNDVIREHAVAELTKAYKIERVDYVWYEITFDDCTTKKYLFIRYSGKEYLNDYKNLKKLKCLLSWGNYYVYDYEIEQTALDKLKIQYSLRDPTSRFFNKYLKYKKKYLELKNKYLEL